MKTRVSIAMGAIIALGFNACTKMQAIQPHIKQITSAMDSTLKTQALLLGKWNVVSDTTYAGVNTGTNPAVYIGQAGDYFDFVADGHIYIKEGAILDTLSFKLASGRQIDINSFMPILNNQSATCQIGGINAKSLSIASPMLTPPAGPQQRIVSLSR
ncbi:hypothetical protein [Mucilaginibacter gotjawali]|uniref:Uncharacterized protein n=2 Tax=Mucilaginibacter gotjawali TaxID=1550579 RepID=A0A110B215_9SPHI|nr:hypothetical protein [Mucilaginibacter gotjawali]MBB3057209.1 hypothetical protein [Mucilaginibacter gotjawali]BAU53024.1 hypothetical protein MgSA37_01191 [Mucilaginibacter gotjawali]